MRLAILAGPHERNQQMHSWTKRASILAAALALTAAGATTAAAWGTGGAGYDESGATPVGLDFEIVHGLTAHVIDTLELTVEGTLKAVDGVVDTRTGRG